MIKLFACWVINFSMLLLSSADFFQTLNFFKKLFQVLYQNGKQFGSRSGRTDIMLVLIRVQTVWKGYQQMTKGAGTNLDPVYTDW